MLIGISFKMIIRGYTVKNKKIKTGKGKGDGDIVTSR